MIIEAAIAVTTLAQAWIASDLNEKALNTLMKAHNTHADAVALFQRHKEDADRSLIKLVNRKKALLTSRFAAFMDVYQQIRKIDFRPGEGILELYTSALTIHEADEIAAMVTTARQNLSEKELAVNYLMGGLGSMLVADAKRNNEIANSQKRIADTLYDQAEVLIIAVDAIGKRAEQMAKLLSQFSLLLGQSTEAASQVIARNGTDRRNYSVPDREVLMTCVNLARAAKTILDVPILNRDGSVSKASLEAISEGNHLIREFQNSIGGNR